MRLLRKWQARRWHAIAEEHTAAGRHDEALPAARNAVWIVRSSDRRRPGGRGNALHGLGLRRGVPGAGRLLAVSLGNLSDSLTAVHRDEEARAAADEAAAVRAGIAEPG